MQNRCESGELYLTFTEHNERKTPVWFGCNWSDVEPETTSVCRVRSMWPGKYGRSTLKYHAHCEIIIFWNSRFVLSRYKLLPQFRTTRLSGTVWRRRAGRTSRTGSETALLAAAAAAAAAGRRLLFTGSKEEEQLPLRTRGNIGSLAIYLIQNFFLEIINN